MRLLRRFVICHVLFAVCYLPAQAQAAADTWGQVPKTIAINPGSTVSVWKDAGRALVTNGLMTMTAVGDGTYEAVVGLTRGATYNYLFFVTTPFLPPGGLASFTEYYDIIPASGYIRASTNGVTTNDTTAAKYASVAFDARRQLTVPAALNPGDTLWVFNNFGETPGVVAGFDAWAEGDTQIRLVWTGPYGSWGQGGESFKAADVLAGGHYLIYRSGTSESGPFTLIATVSGALSTYLDTNVPPDTNWYVIRSRDAYLGGSTITDSFPRLTADTTLPAQYASPRAEVRAFFIVQGADWETIDRQKGLAWLSRAGDPAWCEKIAVRMVRVARISRR